MKKSIITAALLAAFVLGYWAYRSTMPGVVGPLGADRFGRQVLIQGLDGYFDHMNDTAQTGYTIDVTSEWGDRSALQRMLQEPERTTFRVVYRIQRHGTTVDTAFVDRLLESPSDGFLALYREAVILREDLELPVDSVRARLDGLGGRTFQALLSAFGFTRFEVRMGDEPLLGRDLPPLRRVALLPTDSLGAPHD